MIGSSIIPNKKKTTFYLVENLKGLCHKKDFFGKGLNVLSLLSVYALMVFKVFLMLFTTLCNY
jgi:hypothetical protein